MFFGSKPRLSARMRWKVLTIRPAPIKSTSESATSITTSVLRASGYEPRADAAGITLSNCPFHALAAEHTDLVCGMNLALIDALVAPLGENTLTAQLSPAPDRCCVVLTTPNR